MSGTTNCLACRVLPSSRLLLTSHVGGAGRANARFCQRQLRCCVLTPKSLPATLSFSHLLTIVCFRRKGLQRRGHYQGPVYILWHIIFCTTVLKRQSERKKRLHKLIFLLEFWSPPETFPPRFLSHLPQLATQKTAAKKSTLQHHDGTVRGRSRLPKLTLIENVRIHRADSELPMNNPYYAPMPMGYHTAHSFAPPQPAPPPPGHQPLQRCAAQYWQSLPM